jgi:hypothetical protein
MKSYAIVLMLLMLAACGGSDGSPTDTGKPPGGTSYALQILADSAIADPAVGQRCQVIRLTPKTTPTLSGATFQWRSENDSIASVSHNGEVMLHRVGETRVHAILGQDSAVRASQRIRVDAVNQPLFGEFSVAVNGVSRRVDNNTVLAGEYQRRLTYGVLPAYANGRIESYFDGLLTFRDGIEPGAADQCVTAVLNFRWRAGAYPYVPGPHSMTARLFDADGREVYDFVSHFTIQ